MILETEKGTFDSFAKLRYAYLVKTQGNPPIQKFFRQDAWEEETLHISELGKCPRKQMLRLSHASKQVRSMSALANDELMFWQGNIIHALTVAAADWAGIRIAHEEKLPGLPDGWSGHYDLLFRYISEGQEAMLLWDGKSVRQNAFNFAYSWPKKEEIAQMRGYLCFCPEADNGVIEHIDRGGANQPQIDPVSRDDGWVARRIDMLEEYRKNLPELPGVLPRTFDLTYRKVANEPIHRINTITYGPQWECGWCDYLHGYQDKKTKQWTVSEDSPCRPDMDAKRVVAKMAKNRLVYEEPNLQPLVEAWLSDQLLEWKDSEEDVD